jgi:hypothetical protein
LDGAGGGELEPAEFEDGPTASEDWRVWSGGESSTFGDDGAASGWEIRSTVIGSAVTELNVCTSVKSSTNIKADR